MALDVHVVSSEYSWPSAPSPFWFGADTHGLIFYGSTINPDDYPQLSRMKDYYADAQYSGQSLKLLLHELEIVIPRFSADRDTQDALAKFQEVCAQADSEGKTISLICD